MKEDDSNDVGANPPRTGRTALTSIGAFAIGVVVLPAGLLAAAFGGGGGLFAFFGFVAFVIATAAGIRTAWTSLVHREVGLSQALLFAVGAACAIPGLYLLAIPASVAIETLTRMFELSDEQQIAYCKSRFTGREPEVPFVAAGYFEAGIRDIRPIVAALTESGFSYVETDLMVSRPDRPSPHSGIHYYYFDAAFWILSEGATGRRAKYQRFSLAPLDSPACNQYQSFARDFPHFAGNLALLGIPYRTCLVAENVEERQSRYFIQRESLSLPKEYARLDIRKYLLDQQRGTALGEIRFQSEHGRLDRALKYCSARIPEFKLRNFLTSGTEVTRMQRVPARPPPEGISNIVLPSALPTRVQSAKEQAPIARQLAAKKERLGSAHLEDGVFAISSETMVFADGIPAGRHVLLIQSRNARSVHVSTHTAAAEYLLPPVHAGSAIYTVSRFREPYQVKDSYNLLWFDVSGELKAIQPLSIDEEFRGCFPISFGIQDQRLTLILGDDRNGTRHELTYKVDFPRP